MVCVSHGMTGMRWKSVLILGLGLTGLLLIVNYWNFPFHRWLRRTPGKLSAGTNKLYQPGGQDDLEEALNITVGEGTILAAIYCQEIELDMAERRVTMKTTCERYGHSLKVPLKLYNKKLR